MLLSHFFLSLGRLIGFARLHASEAPNQAAQMGGASSSLLNRWSNSWVIWVNGLAGEELFWALLLDFLLFFLLFLGTWLGYKRGFLGNSFFIGAFLLFFCSSNLLFVFFRKHLYQYFPEAAQNSETLTFLAILMLSFATFTLFSQLLVWLIQKSLLSYINHLLGAFLGLLLSAFLLSLFLNRVEQHGFSFIANHVTLAQGQQQLFEYRKVVANILEFSMFYPKILPMASDLISVGKAHFPALKELLSRGHASFDGR